MTSAENQLYRFNYCLALMLVTILIFSNWFLQNIEEDNFNCLFFVGGTCLELFVQTVEKLV